MTRFPRSHPRYRSLVIRARLADALRTGLVVPEGLIAHGRAEAFDYLLGERTSASASKAIQAAARWLVVARFPVISVNGNVAALAGPEIAELVRALPTLSVEVNLFHRTPGRAARVAARLRAAGVSQVLGLHPTVRVPGLPSDRGLVDRRGIARADVVLVPLEDGDRTQALRRIGKRVIAIDLNPLSRTSVAADIPVVDELGRALGRLAREVRAERRRPQRRSYPAFDGAAARADALATINRHLATALDRRGSRAAPAPPRTRPARRRR